MDTKKETLCVGIIMDGNRRWAKERGLSPTEGHEAGAKAFKKIVEAAAELGVSDLVVYAFSTENWKRDETEVTFLMQLIKKYFMEEIDEIIERGARMRFVGQRERFSEDIVDAMGEAEERSQGNEKINVFVALSYGGRADLVQATNVLIEKGEVVTEEGVRNALWTKHMPDPDIIIRTGGEQRLSNFLSWESVYSELFFTKIYWPDFSKRELKDIIDVYKKRNRRFGGG